MLREVEVYSDGQHGAVMLEFMGGLISYSIRGRNGLLIGPFASQFATSYSTQHQVLHHFQQERKGFYQDATT